MFRNNLKTNFLPSTPKLKTGGGFLNKMLKPVQNLVSGGRERPAVTEFSNVLFSEQSEGSIVRLIDSAPGRRIILRKKEKIEIRNILILYYVQ